MTWRSGGRGRSPRRFGWRFCSWLRGDGNGCGIRQVVMMEIDKYRRSGEVGDIVDDNGGCECSFGGMVTSDEVISCN